jgi:hypothetical protein
MRVKALLSRRRAAIERVQSLVSLLPARGAAVEPPPASAANWHQVAAQPLASMEESRGRSMQEALQRAEESAHRVRVLLVQAQELLLGASALHPE